MSKTYDVGDWDRTEYVQEALREAIRAWRVISDLRGLPALASDDMIRGQLSDALEDVAALRERLSRRLGDLISEEMDR